MSDKVIVSFTMSEIMLIMRFLCIVGAIIISRFYMKGWRDIVDMFMDFVIMLLLLYCMGYLAQRSNLI